MMMNDNVATINRIYEAFGKGDWSAIMPYLSDNVEWEQWEDNYAQGAGVPWLKARKGKAGALEFFKIVGEFIFKDFHVISVMGNDDHIAAEIYLDAEIPATGGHLKGDEMHLWSFDEQGKVIRFRHYADTAKHMAAAKLSLHLND